MAEHALRTIANRYTILNLIGQGGMADVYLAHDEILNREVAIKVLRPKLSEDPMTLVRFTREASAASRLSHPNVVDIYDVGESDGLHYIVMEYIRGQTLKQMIIRRGALDYKEALSIMSQLLSAIVSAHEHQIIHRDIKPQNILVKSDGTIKITDFGIAIANGSVSLTHNNAVMGSAHYLSPESAQGKLPDEKVDIYSMGIVFYELLTGQVPYKGNTPAEIALKHMTEPLPSVRRFNPQIPQSIENIVIRASAKDPAERYQKAADMQEDLRHCLDFGKRGEKPLVLRTQKLSSLPSVEKKESRSSSGSDNSGRNRRHPSENQISQTSRRRIAQDSQRQPVSGYRNTSEKQRSSSAFTAKKNFRPVGNPVSHGTRRYRTVLILGVSAVLALVLCAGLLGSGIVRISGFMGYKTFPDLTDLSVEQAEQRLASAGFDPDSIVLKREVSDSVDEGRVIGSDVEPGSIVRGDEPVSLILSKGPSYLISDYTGQFLDDVRNRFAQDSVDIQIEVEYEGIPNTVPGVILGQKELNPGDRIDPDSPQTIVFTVSQYPTIVIPSEIIGMELQEAKNYLNDQGIAAVSGGGLGSGTVVSTDPPVGSTYTQDGTDNVVILYD